MSGENITVNNEPKASEAKEVKRKKVDINVLLNKVRAEDKKEKNENLIFVGLISLVIVVTGIIVSL